MMSRSIVVPWFLGVWLILVSLPASPAAAAEFVFGAASESITPEQPVGLDGQMRTRISKSVRSPCTATALALESREGEKSLDQAILVSCDLVAIRTELSDAVRERLKARLPGFPVEKLVLSATHTHTAPVTQEGKYEGLDAEGVMRPRDYVQFAADRIAEAAAKAWTGRKPGSVGWGLGHAVVAQNRRALYADGEAKMYGQTNGPAFRGLEGHEDDGVEVLFFWDQEKKLIATAVNVSCPSQEVEGNLLVDADFWHEVRESLRKKHGADLQILGWTGAAGDQSPHLMYRKAAEERMRTLRGLTRLEELARRIVVGWEEAYEGAARDMQTDVPLVHTVRPIELPKRVVTEKEYEEAKQTAAEQAKDPAQRTLMNWNLDAVERYEKQQRGPIAPYQMELHVLRLGDVAIATNDFELYTDFGVQMKSRSPAVQTFVIQLSGPGSYLATARAVRAGSYSAIVQSTLVGPEGGQELVEQTVSAIQTLWQAK
ncbi:hypothetical protein [Planctomyces sp. SH-PL14]|uniref:hypothetical protein n=1 Tax=Planctomyces sp. SH-PL14 TaxID=1632864 RepID=UPI00078B2DC6|nr:hypothetical protein [Planctomyces sp. SH-PL14]AMV17795.1 hypothetical protein VT03_07875 [Planctomyces sp. SH-PL14]